MGGKPAKRKKRGPIHRLKSWAKTKAKRWISGKVRTHLVIGGGAQGRGLPMQLELHRLLRQQIRKHRADIVALARERRRLRVGGQGMRRSVHSD